MVERSIAWLTRGNRRVPYRGIAKNNAWLHPRVAALNLRRLLALGLTATRQPGPWPDQRTSPTQPPGPRNIDRRSNPTTDRPPNPTTAAVQAPHVNPDFFRGLLDLIPAHHGHFAYTSGDHGDLWLDLDALFAHPRRLRPYVVPRSPTCCRPATSSAAR